MKNFLKKHAAMIIGLALITAIICLALSLTGGKPSAPPLTGDDLDDLSGQTSKPQDPPGTTDPPKETITYIPALPKPSLASEDYLFTQSLCGVGNVTLAEIHQTSVGLYTVAETDCAVGDIAGKVPTVGVAKSDALGNVTATVSIPSTSPSYYVSSQITKIGLVVITSNENKKNLFVHIVDYDLTEVKTKLLPYAAGAKIYPTADSFIVLENIGDESVIYNYSLSDAEFVFHSMPACDIVRLFEYGDYYKIFYNSERGYGFLELTKSNFVARKETQVSTCSLVDILPLEGEDGKQVFIALELDGWLYVRRYGSDFSLTGSERKRLGKCEVLGLGTDGKKLYLAIGGNSINGIVSIGPDLSTSFPDGTAAFIPSDIYDYVYTRGAFYLLASDSSGRLALIQMSDEGTEATYFENKGEKARLALNANGTFTVVCGGAFHDYRTVSYIGIK